MAKAFIPREKGKELINHLDGNPLNNKVNNLEWCNQSENMYHAYESGLIKSNFTKNKERILNEYTNDKNTNVDILARKYSCSDRSIRNYLKEKGIKIRGVSETNDIYKIDRVVMATHFEEGLSNKEIATMFGANKHLIAVYRHKHKKGELLV